MEKINQAFCDLYQTGRVKAGSAFEMAGEAKLPKSLRAITEKWQPRVKDVVLIGIPAIAFAAAVGFMSGSLGYGKEDEMVNPDSDPGEDWELE